MCGTVLAAAEDSRTREGSCSSFLEKWHATHHLEMISMTLISTTYFAGGQNTLAVSSMSRSVVPNGRKDLAPSAR